MQFLEAPVSSLREDMRTYNIQAVSFTPAELVEEVRKHLPELQVDYEPDERQDIGEWAGHMTVM